MLWLAPLLLMLACQQNAEQRIGHNVSLSHLPNNILHNASKPFNPQNIWKLPNGVAVVVLSPNGDTLMPKDAGYTLKQNRIYQAILGDANDTKRMAITTYAKDFAQQWPTVQLAVKPFDAGCFTQGFTVQNNVITYSCGQYGQGRVVQLNHRTGKLIKQQPIGGNYFLEGIDAYKNGYLCLTWREKTIFRLDNLLEVQDALALPKPLVEGWGIAVADTQIFISDGTSRVYKTHFNKANKLVVDAQLNVHINGQPLNHINEMAVANDTMLFMNQWYSNTVYAASINSGAVFYTIDFSQIAQINSGFGVLNGIHFRNDTLWVTGKNWPNYYLFQASLPY